MRWKPWISATPLAIIAIAPAVTLTSAAKAADDNDAIAHLSETVNSIAPSVSSDDRDLAAQQMVDRDDAAAHAAVTAALKNTANPAAETSVAKAIAQAAHPSELFVPVLGDLLGPNPAVTEAAASALANFPGNVAALDRLKKFVDNPSNSESVRAAVLRDMGQLIDKPAADYLFNLTQQPRQTASIQTAALAALAEMTGINEFGSDPRLWKQWWDTMGVKNPDQFRAALLQTRVRQFNQMKRRNQLLAESARKLLIDDYRALPAGNKHDVLLKYLDDPAPEVRSVGVTLVKLYLNTTPPTDDVRARLFQLIGDSDESVRSDVDELLLTLNVNDPKSLHSLITQLSKEKDPRVAQKIAQILGNLKDANAAPEAALALGPMLKDSNKDSAIAAAKALANLGGNVRKKDPALADALSDQLRTKLKAIDNQKDMNPLRAACLGALGELRDSKSLDTFLDCFKPGESAEVRKAALIGLGALGDTRASDVVLGQLDDLDPTIRLEAAHALVTVATPDQDIAINKHMRDDRDADVSRAMWIAFAALLPRETKEQLEHWATVFDEEPDRKIIIQQVLGDQLKKANNLQAIADNNQAIAATMMRVKPTPMVTEATAHLQLALDYWRGPGRGTGGSDANLETLVGQMLDVRLAAEEWGPACSFAAEQITSNGSYQTTVGPRIKDKIDELIKTNNLTAAQKLIDVALAMKPPLDQHYIGQIQSAQNDLRNKPTGP